jgi:hypothetical protein
MIDVARRRKGLDCRQSWSSTSGPRPVLCVPRGMRLALAQTFSRVFCIGRLVFVGKRHQTLRQRGRVRLKGRTGQAAVAPLLTTRLSVAVSTFSSCVWGSRHPRSGLFTKQTQSRDSSLDYPETSTSTATGGLILSPNSSRATLSSLGRRTS